MNHRSILWGTGGVLAVGLGVATAGAGPPDPLPRRGYLGLSVTPLSPGTSERLGTGEARGVFVRLLPGLSPAGAAGLAVEDVIRSINGVPTPNLSRFEEVASALRAGGVARLAIARGAERFDLLVPVEPLPVVRLPGLDVRLSSFPVGGGVRLRSVLSHPPGGARAAVLLLQDVTGPSVEAGGYNPSPLLAARLGKAGFAVVRFDRRGVGDSQGEIYLDAGFEAEVADARAALEHLRETTSAERIVILGVGAGALIGAQLAAESPDVDALVGFRPVGRPWVAHALDTVRRSGRRAGVPSATMDSTLVVLEQYFALAGGGSEDAAIFARHPSWRPIVLDSGGRPYGRSARYFRELSSPSPAARYRAVPCRVAAVIGATDPFSSPADVEAIDRARAGRATDRLVLPETDHAFARAQSPDESVTNHERGTLVLSAPGLDALVAWLEDARDAALPDDTAPSDRSPRRAK